MSSPVPKDASVATDAIAALEIFGMYSMIVSSTHEFHGSNSMAFTGNSIQVVHKASRNYTYSFNTGHAFSASYQVSHCRNVFLKSLGAYSVPWLVQYAYVSLITTSGQAFACTALLSHQYYRCLGSRRARGWRTAKGLVLITCCCAGTAAGYCGCPARVRARCFMHRLTLSHPPYLACHVLEENFTTYLNMKFGLRKQVRKGAT